MLCSYKSSLTHTRGPGPGAEVARAHTWGRDSRKCVFFNTCWGFLNPRPSCDRGTVCAFAPITTSALRAPWSRRGITLNTGGGSRPCVPSAEGDAAAAAGDQSAGHRRHAGGAVGAAGDGGPELRHVRWPWARPPASGRAGQAAGAPPVSPNGLCCCSLGWSRPHEEVGGQRSAKAPPQHAAWQL